MRTEATFRVTGRSIFELESSAMTVIGDLFKHRSGGVVFDMDIEPLVHALGSEIPQVWEARVTARENAA